MAGTSVSLVILSLALGVLAKDKVPVLVWKDNQEHSGIPAIPAMQTVDYATFQNKYLASFEPKNIILFLQDALSIEDLSSHAAEFEPLRRWMSTSHSLYLPNVKDPAHLTHDLASHGYNVVTLEPGVPAAGLDLKKQDDNLVVVKLPSTLTNPSRSHALQKAVEVMHNVISKIGAKREFTFIFTGEKPSMEDNSHQMYEARVRVPRAAVMPSQRGFHRASCVKMYFFANISLSVTYSTEETKTYEVSGTPTSETGNCDTASAKSRTAQFLMRYNGGVDPLTKLVIQFNFTESGGTWNFVNAGVMLNNDPEVAILDLKYPDVSGIPIGMSYSCAQNIYLSSNSSSSSSSVKMMSMTLNGIQMEPFFVKNGTKFAPAWDCVGFFTIPIWTGLLTTLLLLIIISYGMYMLSDIKTMDRFDDPKGQPIMVPTSD